MEAGNLAKRNETKKQGSKEAKRTKELATEAQRHREKQSGRRAHGWWLLDGMRGVVRMWL
jgi:hypothetical protein